MYRPQKCAKDKFRSTLNIAEQCVLYVCFVLSLKCSKKPNLKYFRHRRILMRKRTKLKNRSLNMANTIKIIIIFKVITKKDYTEKILLPKKLKLIKIKLKI